MKSEVDLFLEAIPDLFHHTEKGQTATEEEVARFEMNYGVKLPADVREYFLKLNHVAVAGFFIEILPVDEWSTAVEYLAKWAPNHTESLPENYFRFGHYDLFVWEWVVMLSDDPESDTPIFVWTEGFKQIADSFSDFLRKYRSHGPESLLGYD